MKPARGTILDLAFARRRCTDTTSRPPLSASRQRLWTSFARVRQTLQCRAHPGCVPFAIPPRWQATFDQSCCKSRSAALPAPCLWPSRCGSPGQGEPALRGLRAPWLKPEPGRHPTRRGPSADPNRIVSLAPEERPSDPAGAAGPPAVTAECAACETPIRT